MINAATTTIATRLADAGLAARVCKSLRRRGLPSRVLDDVLQEARKDVWLLFERAPRDAADLEPLFFHTAKCRAIDWMRRMGRERLREDYAELAEDLPQREGAAQALETLAEVEDTIGGDPQLEQALEDVAAKTLDGEEYDDIARRRGVSAGSVRKGVFRLREHIREHLGDYRNLVVLMFVLVAGALGRLTPHEPPAWQAPRMSAPEPAREAAALRREAREAYDVGRYDECLRALDKARALDEAGDATDEVRKLREAARDASR
jgi:RNA polymerase sigma factor (sigma-70 family)